MFNSFIVLFKFCIVFINNHFWSKIYYSNRKKKYFFVIYALQVHKTNKVGCKVFQFYLYLISKPPILEFKTEISQKFLFLCWYRTQLTENSYVKLRRDIEKKSCNFIIIKISIAMLQRYKTVIISLKCQAKTRLLLLRALRVVIASKPAVKLP